MADQTAKRRGRPVGSGSGKRPEMRERADADLGTFVTREVY